MGSKLIRNFVTVLCAVIGIVGENVVLITLLSNDFSWKVNTLVLIGFELVLFIMVTFAIKEQLHNQTHHMCEVIKEIKSE